MTEAAKPASDEAPEAVVSSRQQELARTLQAKVAQGYRVESQHETGAVVVVNAPKRWFGLSSGAEQRSELSVDEAGHVSSRRI
jgi:hypothetical protein